MTEFQLEEVKGINGLVGQEELSRTGPALAAWIFWTLLSSTVPKWRLRWLLTY